MRRQACPPSLARRLPLAVIGIASVAVFLVVGLANAALLLAQSATADWEKAAGGHMEFDVASVKQTTQPSYMDRSNVPLDARDSFTPSGSLFSTTGGRVADYMVFAYKFTNAQRYEASDQLPEWANANSYAIEARAAGNPTKDQYRLMMQALLADRFRLSFHYETKQMPVLALVLIKPGKVGPKLMPHSAADSCPNTARIAGPMATVAGGFPQLCGTFYQMVATVQNHYAGGARNVPMSMIAESLTQFIGSPKPVLDKTGLAGNYDFLIDFTLTDAGVPLDPNGSTFLEALKDQLGLKLEQQMAPMEVIVIDHIEPPSAN